jgi:hypothetical protein
VGTLALAAPAAALQIGPVSVGDGSTPISLGTTPASAPVADTTTTTAPALLTVGPVTVPTPGAVSGLLPGLGVSIEPSPSETTIGVSLPTAIGPVPLPPGTLQGAQVSLGSDGATVTLDPGSGAPGPTSGSAGPVTGPSTGDPSAAVPDPAAPSLRPGSGNVAGPAPVGSDAPAAAAGAGRPGSAIPTTATPGAVNASLRRVAPHSGWSFVRELTSARTLWLALVVIMLVGRWALVGLVRDARRSQRPLTAR